ncbi:bile acid:sodium symporter family protein [Alicyclobacillus sp. SO9]|uniref:bile acid:sodium symporter family protein n=1 Tax=Alicyclobacillus sp. SO9 TaxID=2665646 RepID=UPI0018E8E97F|nr:bile acid:sodium symporter family protein [Alicyclobacillus sp. SO9]QQE77579.1 bile acid:sodium symporter family protein [Alicyclobacillus sp. SO9]
MTWREIGSRANDYLEKWMSAGVISAIAIGYVCHSWMADGKSAVIVLFAFMTFVTALGTRIRDITYVLRSPWKVLLVIALTHILLPLIAFSAGKFTLSQFPQYITGIVLAACIPVGVTSVMWTDLTRGNLALALSIVSIDTLFSPLILPFSVHLILGKSVSIPVVKLVWGLIWMVVLPTIIGITLNEMSKGRIKPAIHPVASPLSKLAMLSVVAINVAVVSPSLGGHKGILKLLMVLISLVIIGYLTGHLSGRIVAKDNATRISMTYGVGMRNISAGITIATQYFSHAASIPVVLMLLFQQPSSTVVYWLYRRYGQGRKGRVRKEHTVSN